MTRPTGSARIAWIGGAAALAAALLFGLPLLRTGSDRADGEGGSRKHTARGAIPGDGGLLRPQTRIRLRDVTAQTGITFRHTDGSSGRRYIVEAMSTGIATFDYDGDGRIDIYFPNGAPLPGCTVETPPRHALYRNLGDWRFEDVSDQAGIACNAYGMGVTVGDYDNDGDPDLFLNNFGRNILYRNEGDGTFSDVTAQAGVAGLELVAAGACFLDVEGDGDLDLYVGNYIELDCAAHQPHEFKGYPSYPSPKEYEPVIDTLYRNNGDGTFTDVSESSGIAAHAGRSMGMICADSDHDGDTDVFICNDVQENFLFRNDGKGHFEEYALIAGTALAPQGSMLANMAVDCADYDGDGHLDFFTTNYQGQLPMLLRNLGNGLFQNLAAVSNATAGSLHYVNWGCGFVDFDNDGHRDIFVANGHTEDNVEERDDTTMYRCPNLLLQNTGKGTFIDVPVSPIGALPPVEASRGTAFDDLDNDGDIDAVILNSRRPPTILRNMLHESQATNHWIQIRLRGTKTNRDGVGAHVAVVTQTARHVDEVHAGRGYQSHWGSRLHFGLGPEDRVERIEIRWLGGAREVFAGGASDRLITLVEGDGRPGETVPGESD